MSQYPTVETVSKEVDEMLAGYTYKIPIRSVCNKLSIFDWWPQNLTQTHLKQMQSFLAMAKKIGFTGYCCFKVGASGCANGMWAYKEQSTNGYSPNTKDMLYRSFTPDYTTWIYNDGETHIETKSVNELKKALFENMYK